MEENGSFKLWYQMQKKKERKKVHEQLLIYNKFLGNF